MEQNYPHMSILTNEFVDDLEGSIIEDNINEFCEQAEDSDIEPPPPKISKPSSRKEKRDANKKL